MGRREGGKELREKHLFPKCVSSVVMGVKCLFVLCMISESSEQSPRNKVREWDCSLCIHSSSDGHLDVSALCPVNSTAESIQMYISVRFVFTALG